MKKKLAIALLSIGSMALLAGCKDANDDIPAGASFKDPTGMNAKAAAGKAGAAPTVSPEQKKMATQAQNFGAQMNAKYGGSH